MMPFNMLALAVRYWWVAALGSLLLFGTVQTARITRLKAALTTAQEAVTSERLGKIDALAQRDGLRGLVRTQNEAVAALKAEADRKARLAAEAVSEARRGQRAAQNETARLMAVKPTSDLCLSAELMLRGAL